MSIAAKEDTGQLIIKAQQGDQCAFDELVRENMGLVHMAARRFIGRGTDYEDLVQIGCLGLIKAIKRFDVTMDVMFSTYAVPAILGEIKRHFRDTGSIKISRSIKENAIKCSAARDELSKKLNREPTLGELSEMCNITVEDIMTALDAMQPILSLDESLDDSDDSTKFSAFVGKDDSESLIENIALSDAISKLSSKEKKIVTMRFFKGKTQMDTAKEMGISQVQVSRSERNIVEKLRKLLK